MDTSNRYYAASEKGIQELIRYAKGTGILIKESPTGSLSTIRPLTLCILQDIRLFRVINCRDLSAVKSSLEEVRRVIRTFKKYRRLAPEKLLLEIHPEITSDYGVELWSSRIAKELMKRF